MAVDNDLQIEDKGFLNYPVEWVKSLWLMKRDDPRKLQFHGGNIPEIQRRLFHRYTRQGDVVIDWFLGSGTSILVGNELGRKIIGVDLDPKLLEFRTHDLRHHIIITGDSSNSGMVKMVQSQLFRHGYDGFADFTFLHPPYHNIIQFTKDNPSPHDLSRCNTAGEFQDLFRLVAKNAYDTLKAKGWAALLIGDIYSDGSLIPLSYYCMDAMREVGFNLKAEIVKDINNNEAKGRSFNLWWYRHLKNGTYFFDHEKIYIFRKEK